MNADARDERRSRRGHRLRMVGRVLGRAVLMVIGVFFVVRALIEVVMLNPRDPASYRHDWGGPHYLGVLLVHVLPGVVAVLLAWLYLRRRLSLPMRDRSVWRWPR